MTTALKRKSRTGWEPERQETAIKRGENVPHPPCNFKHFSATRLLVKPLDCHLKGLLNKVDRLDHTKVIQSIKDCVAFIQIESERLDSEVSRV